MLRAGLAIALGGVILVVQAWAKMPAKGVDYSEDDLFTRFVPIYRRVIRLGVLIAAAGVIMTAAGVVQAVMP